MTFLYTVSQNNENAWAVGEFKCLILVTTVWFEVFAGFHFFLLRKQTMLRIDVVALEVIINGSQMDYSL